MFNVGAGEMVFILVAALLILGPKKLPELARGIGKFLRDFRRQTDDVRKVVEREFYAMDQEIIPALDAPDPSPRAKTSNTAPPATLPEEFATAGEQALPTEAPLPVETSETPELATAAVPGAIPKLQPPVGARPRTFSTPDLATPGLLRDPSVAGSQELEPVSSSVLPDDAGSHGKAD